MVADLSGIQMHQIGEELVRVTGVKGLPPPPTTKVGITLPGGFQAEWHIWMCGLDIEEKCKVTENQIRYAIGDNISRFTKLKFQQMGYSAVDAPNQDVATVDFRVFAQTKDPELLRPDVPNGFNRWVLETFLQSAPVCLPVISMAQVLTLSEGCLSEQRPSSSGTETVLRILGRSHAAVRTRREGAQPLRC